MKDLFVDIKGFLSSLTQIDFLLYLAVLFLIIMVVSLFYILKNSDIDEDEIENMSNKLNDGNEFDIKETATNLEQVNSTIIDYTPYEEEQEEKAIISYDELLAQNQKQQQYAEKIIDNEELSIKKIDLTKKVVTPDLPKTSEEKINKQEIKMSPNLLKYNKEEEFLKTLKAFSKLLD